jgi:hypothetical protein
MSNRKGTAHLRPYWYLVHVGECPVCGRDQSHRERRYGKPPKKREHRYRPIPLNQCYCGCGR